MTDMYVPALALCYLALQISTMFWSSPAWRRAGRFPLWAFGASIVVLVVGGSFGAPLAPILLLVSLPMMIFYLGLLWTVYLLVRPRPQQVAV